MAAESIKLRIAALTSGLDKQEMLPLILSIQTDLTAFRTIFNAHVHSGITVGAANSAVSTTLVPVLNTQP